MKIFKNISKQKFRPIKAILCRLIEELHEEKNLPVNGCILYN